MHPDLNPRKKTGKAFVAEQKSPQDKPAEPTGKDTPTVAPGKDGPAVCLVAKHAVYAAQAEADSHIDWIIIHSGCSRHTTNDESLCSCLIALRQSRSLCSLETPTRRKSPATETSRSASCCAECLQSAHCEACCMSLHVPDLAYSLLSARNMDDAKGLLYTMFGEMRCWIKTKTNELMATGTLLRHPYRLDTDPARPIMDKPFLAHDLDIAHQQRLAHISARTHHHEDGS